MDILNFDAVIEKCEYRELMVGEMFKYHTSIFVVLGYDMGLNMYNARKAVCISSEKPYIADDFEPTDLVQSFHMGNLNKLVAYVVDGIDEDEEDV